LKFFHEFKDRKKLLECVCYPGDMRGEVVRMPNYLFRYKYKKKKLIKLILVNFSNKYGKPIITESLLELIKDNKLDI